MKRILITGAYGFIGTHVTQTFLENTEDELFLLDGLTYAAQPFFIKHYLEMNPHLKPRVMELICDIRDQSSVAKCINHYGITDIVHLAAESHVCRSIAGPRTFFETNVMGTFNLIEEFRLSAATGRFLHVSTDEVFGELSDDPSDKFNLQSPVAPRSPYAASKASSDHLVQCYHHTYGLDTVITNCTNNFGPYQHQEKLIPRTVSKLKTHEPMTVYGPGTQVRDWLYVEDHAKGILAAFERGREGARYLFGGDAEYSNLQIISIIADIMETAPHIVHTNDRPTDDKRYAMDTLNTKNELNWHPSNPVQWQNNMIRTVRYYS